MSVLPFNAVFIRKLNNPSPKVIFIVVCAPDWNVLQFILDCKSLYFEYKFEYVFGLETVKLLAVIFPPVVILPLWYIVILP